VQLEGCLNLQATLALKGAPGFKYTFRLQQCLMFANEFSATIPHDKIFSMLGLAGDSTDLALNPGYRVSAQDLYTSTTRYLFKQDRSFELLHLAGIGYPRSLSGLPSWVPDFSYRRNSAILGCRDDYANLDYADACFEYPNEMKIIGIYIDKIREARDPIPEISHSYDRTKSK
jgi:hypothetical protein